MDYFLLPLPLVKVMFRVILLLSRGYQQSILSAIYLSSQNDDLVRSPGSRLKDRLGYFTKS